MTGRLIDSINMRGVKVKVMESNTRHYVITPDEVSRKLKIGIKKAKEMLRLTTQKGIRHAVHTLHRRYIFDNMHLNRKRLNAQFYTDHLLDKTKPLEGNMGPCIYTTGIFAVANPFINCSGIGDTLRWFSDDIGVLDILSSHLEL